VVEGYELRILAEDADGPGAPELPRGEIGVLWVKGDSVAQGYFRDREKSWKTFHGHWCRTGDLFRLDEEGYLWFSGRADDLLKVGGIFVAPTEIEAVLMEHDGVLECVVVGYDEAGLTKHKAVVVPRSGWAPDLTLEGALIAHARRRLVAYKVPRKIEFSVGLPRNDRGKISRREVK
jgi:acyl-coenzyme A synthetase/AMP-(fatty) acid ligase